MYPEKAARILSKAQDLLYPPHNYSYVLAPSPEGRVKCYISHPETTWTHNLLGRLCGNGSKISQLFCSLRVHRTEMFRFPNRTNKTPQK